MNGKLAGLILATSVPLIAFAEADTPIGYNLATGQPVSTPAATVTRPAAPPSKPIVVSAPVVQAPSNTWPVAQAPSTVSQPQVVSTTNPSWFSTVFGNKSAFVGDGLAVGVQLGYSSAEDVYAPSDTQTRGLEGGLAGLHFDYGYTFTNSLYLGIELYGNIENSSSDFSSQVAPYENTKLKIGNNIGLVLLPGFHLNTDNLIYAKIGVNRAQVSINVNGADYSNSQTAGDLGLGFRQALNSNFSLALEYDWMNYSPALNAPSFAGPTTNNKFNQQVYQLSLNYQFDQINPPKTQQQRFLRLTGPYLGIDAGPKSEIYNASSYYISSDQTVNAVFVGNGWAERFKAGYGYQFNNRIYLGAEFYAELDQRVGPQEFSTEINQEDHSYALSILPGYVINESNLFFTRVGAVSTNFTGSHSCNCGGSDSTYNQRVTGYLLGVGYETALTQAVSLSFEYDYSHYPSFDGNVTDENIANTYNVHDSYMGLGLNYRF